jgi:hypothetical protein
MKSTARLRQFGALAMAPALAMALALAVALTTATAAFPIADDTLQHSGDLTVHEWGTFTSVAGADGSAIDWDVLGGKDDLPGFVKDQGYRCVKSRLGGTVRMETPVIYFYSPREVTARVRVLFPHGVITEWYPNGDNAIYESQSLMDQMGATMRSTMKSRMYSDGDVYQTKSLIDPAPHGLGPALVRLSPSLNGIDTSLRNLMGAIGWNDIKIQPGSTAGFPDERRPSRYYAARGTDATPITAGDQHEKFLFYRGVARIPVPLSARLSEDGRVAVENRGPDPIPTAILFENRGGRLGYRNAGAIESSGAIQSGVTLDRPSLDGSFSQLRQDLESALVAQGLFPKEAQAMVETWRDSWFEEGSRLIYIVPAHAIDAILPLQIDPAPSQTARVFVGRIELVTEETKRLVEEAFARNDWPVIERYARFLDPILARISTESPWKAQQVEQYLGKIPSSIGAGGCR